MNTTPVRFFALLAVSAACGNDTYLRPQSVETEFALASEAYEPVPSVQAFEPYDSIVETGFQDVQSHPRSTFSVDVDTASYANVRRFLMHGQRPPADAVRVEELINYFDYAYPQASGEHPIAIATELAHSPFDPSCALLRVSLAAHDVARVSAPPKNLVFLVDVSGSMADSNKLPLLKASLELLVEQLDERDRVAIVAYAGESGVVLPPTRGDERRVILDAIAALGAGGSTNGAGGIEQAYDLAVAHFRDDAINRVILATDGDFNVGITSRGELLRLIERRRTQGVFLSVLGFGMGNLKDATMELLADHGNGNYAYIDTLREARKVLVDEMSATLNTVAQDAKLQLSWDAAAVKRYRLIGYENRRLADRDFEDDEKDAGDLGDGHQVTALYEVELAPAAERNAPLVAIEVRYKRPGASASQLLRAEVRGEPRAFEVASEDLRFASAVAGFGMLLRDSPYRGQLDFDGALALARSALGRDAQGHRAELVELVGRAQRLYAD